MAVGLEYPIQTDMHPCIYDTYYYLSVNLNNKGIKSIYHGHIDQTYQSRSYLYGKMFVIHMTYDKLM